jgi:hypothetical protein
MQLNLQRRERLINKDLAVLTEMPLTWQEAWRENSCLPSARNPHFFPQRIGANSGALNHINSRSFL